MEYIHAIQAIARFNSHLQIVTMKKQPFADLTYAERVVLGFLYQVPQNTVLGYAVHVGLAKLTVKNFRQLVCDLLSQWEDNPNIARACLGFDLPQTLKMKAFTSDSINKELSAGGYVFRAVGEVPEINAAAQWAAQAGIFSIMEVSGTVYVDNLLNRYIRLSNGQIFHCSNLDLTSLPDLDKTQLVAYLSGLID